MIKKINDVSEIKKEMFSMPWSVYPYANFLKYGIEREFYSLFVINNCFFTKYHDSIQICSKNISVSVVPELVNYIKKNKIRMITGPTECLDLIYNSLQKGRIEHGFIYQFTPFAFETKYMIDRAIRIYEFRAVAELVCEANSNNLGFYGLEQYFNQIYSRFSDGYCRNYICLLNNKIIGHIATYAETPIYGVLGGLAVDVQFRGHGIAKALLSKSISELNKEGKDVYAFCFNNLLFAFYDSISIHSYPTSKIILK